jgi:phage shock protein A
MEKRYMDSNSSGSGPEVQQQCIAVDEVCEVLADEVRRLRAEVRRLRAELSETRAQRDMFRDASAAAEQRIRDLNVEAERLFSASIPTE